MTERTLLIIKPDAVEQNVVGKIIERIEDAGYCIKNMKMVLLNREIAESFYAVHRGKPFFEPLINFMISGPSIPIVLEGEDVVSGLRELIGSTDPSYAEEGTIRKDFATNGRRNAVHASDSVETANREISFFFDSKGLEQQTIIKQ